LGVGNPRSAACALPKSLHPGAGSPWIVARDVLTDREEVRDRALRPAQHLLGGLAAGPKAFVELTIERIISNDATRVVIGEPLLDSGDEARLRGQAVELLGSQQYGRRPAVLSDDEGTLSTLKLSYLLREMCLELPNGDDVFGDAKHAIRSIFRPLHRSEYGLFSAPGKRPDGHRAPRLSSHSPSDHR